MDCFLLVTFCGAAGDSMASLSATATDESAFLSERKSSTESMPVMGTLLFETEATSWLEVKSAEEFLTLEVECDVMFDSKSLSTADDEEDAEVTRVSLSPTVGSCFLFTWCEGDGLRVGLVFWLTVFWSSWSKYKVVRPTRISLGPAFSKITGLVCATVLDCPSKSFGVLDNSFLPGLFPVTILKFLMDKALSSEFVAVSKISTWFCSANDCSLKIISSWSEKESKFLF